MTASDICGAWGGCPLPKGHNMGRLDIPENHAAPPAPDPAWVEAGVAALGIDFVDPLAVEAVIAAVEPLIRREVLDDLRAKVEALPYRTWVPPHATDCPGRPGKRGICTCGDSLRASDWMLRADVLALIEEADRG